MKRTTVTTLFLILILHTRAQVRDTAELNIINQDNIELQKDSQNCDIRFDRARSLENIGNFQDAISDWSYYILHCNPDYIAYNFRAQNYRKLDKFSEAIKDYKEAMNTSENKAELLYEMGYCYAGLKMVDSAIVSYGNAIDLDNKQAICFYNRGLLEIELKEVEAACADFKKALVLGLSNAKYPFNDFCK